MDAAPIAPGPPLAAPVVDASPIAPAVPVAAAPPSAPTDARSPWVTAPVAPSDEEGVDWDAPLGTSAGDAGGVAPAGPAPVAPPGAAAANRVEREADAGVWSDDPWAADEREASEPRMAPPAAPSVGTVQPAPRRGAQLGVLAVALLGGIALAWWLLSAFLADMERIGG